MLKKNLNKISLLAASVAFMGLSTQSFAADSMGAMGAIGVAGNIGFGSISASGATGQSGLTFGANVNYRLDPTWEVGVDWTMQSYAIATGSALNVTFMTFMAEMDYHLAGDLNPLYFGIRAGLGMSSIPAIGAIPSSSSSSFGFGAQTGYDYMIMQNLTVGPKLAFTYFTSNPSTIYFQALASITYHF